jgi:signal transduction histidine kinase/response regulator of citrate/malate metabolism
MLSFVNLGRIAYLIGFILFLIGIIHFFPEIEPKEQLNYVDLRNNLLYKLAEDSEWKKFETKSYDFESPVNRKIWMRIYLPEFKIPNNFLYIEVIEISARFYLDGELIHTHGKWDNLDRPSKFTNFFSSIIQLPERASGKFIDVELHSDWKRIGLRRQIGIGHYEEIISRYIKVDIPNLIFSFFYIILGISCFVIFSFTKEKLIFYLGSTSLPLGLASIAEMNFNLTPYLYFQFTPFIGWVSYFLVVLFFMKYTEELYELKENLIFKYFHFWLFIVFLFAWFILFTYGFTFNYTAYLEIPFGVTLAIGGVLILISSINFAIKGNVEARIFLIGITIFIIGSMNYTLFMLNLNEDLESDTHLLFFPMILCSVWIIGLRYRKNQRLLLEYSKELEESQILLEERIKEKTLNLEISNQKLIESDKSKTEFFANVSHEFKTPLTLILAPLERIIESCNDSNQLFLLQTIKRNALRMEYLVEDLLAVAKIDFGYFKPKLIDIEISEYLKRFIHDFDFLCQQKGLILSYSLPNEILYKQIHKTEWDLIIRNILSNAIKFTSEGSIEFNVTFEKEKAVIQVKDTGIGIEDKEIDKIFNRFYRAEKTLDLSIIGSGIGLHIVNKLVSICGGDIHINSKPNKGSEFTIQMPAFTSSVFPIASDITQSNHNNVSEYNSLQNILNDPFIYTNQNILIIEDEDDMARFLSFILKNSYNLTLATNAEEAIDILKTQKFDLIVSDWNLPKMNGGELLSAIRDLEIDTPFLFLTALTGNNHQELAFDLGADDFITKPFETHDLINRIKLRLNKQKYIHETITKEKDIVYSDIHDIIGGQMFELHILINQIQLNEPLQVEILNKVKNMITTCTKELRNKLHQWEDLQLIQTNFELGWKSMLIRRYNNLGRGCMIEIDHDSKWDETEIYSEQLKEELYRISLEISNNDIKYGYGDSKWKIHSFSPFLHLEMISATKFKNGSIYGRGSRDLKERTSKIKGTLEYITDGGSFKLNLQVPVKNI